MKIFMVIHIYSPKISEDLIPVLYRIGKKQGKPMTKVVDNLLRDSIKEYITNSDESEQISCIRPNPKPRKIEIPVVGEIVRTPYGTGEVIDVKYWRDIEDGLPDGDEKDTLKNRAEFFLGDVKRYFEYTVIYEEGDTATFDYSSLDEDFARGNQA